jgi:hypothetical protein
MVQFIQNCTSAHPSLIEPGKTILSVLVCWLSTKVSKALFNSELVGSQLTRFSEFLEG